MDIKTATVMRSVGSGLGSFSRSSESFGILFLTFASQAVKINNDGMNHRLGARDKPGL